MQFIQRLRLRFRSRRAVVREICAVSRLLMAHVGMSGRLECLISSSAEGRSGFVLRLTTLQRIPQASREEIQWYFIRKLDQMVVLQGAPVLLLIQDADDQARARHANRSVSSGRVASVVAAANLDQDHLNLPAERLDDLRRDVRRRLRERRDQRHGDSPMGGVPLTELASLRAN